MLAEDLRLTGQRHRTVCNSDRQGTVVLVVVSQGTASIRQSRGPGGTRAHTVGNPEFIEPEYFTKDSNHAYPSLQRVTLYLPKLFTKQTSLQRSERRQSASLLARYTEM